ncbi:MAG: winged helix-turn-helix transcriptional regulator [Ruminiclostridium sp.]
MYLEVLFPVEYSLTGFRRTLIPILYAMNKWKTIYTKETEQFNRHI